MISFDHNENIQKIFAITHIKSTKVKIEAMRKPKERLIQCKKCQRFGHTKSFCNREAKCVKCAGNHLSFECKMEKKQPPKCSNCHESHTANYRGCMVAKELQKRRKANKNINAKEFKPQKIPTLKTVKEVSFSDVDRRNLSDSTPKLSYSKKPDTPKHKLSIKINTTVKVTKPPKTTFSKEELFMISMERMITKMDEISSRLKKMESRYAGKHIRTPKSILK